MQELKTELRFALTYLDSLRLLENEHSMKATKEAIEHALNLLKIINDRIKMEIFAICIDRIPGVFGNHTCFLKARGYFSYYSKQITS